MARRYAQAADGARDQVQAVAALALRRAGFTQVQAADLIGGHEQTVANWVHGRRDPAVVDLAQLVAACGLRLRLVLDEVPAAAEEEVA